MRRLLTAALLATAPTAFAQLSLTADSAPGDKAWENPATIAYTRNGDHTSNTTIDAYLKYSWSRTRQAELVDTSAKADTLSVAGYIHKDNQSRAKQNDRGLALGYRFDFLPDDRNSGAQTVLSLNAVISAGKSMQAVEADATTLPEQYFDKTKDRQQLFVSGYVQPAIGTGQAGARALGRKSVQYLRWIAGMYSDHNSGGSGSSGNKGRLSGANGRLEWSVMPLGLVAGNNRIGAYGVVPVFALAAQIQHDTSARGSREKDTYKLYTAALRFDFETLASDGKTRLVPSLVIQRSIGADLLAGRAYEGKTEIAFGVTF
jgi:hypothetical protein